MLNLIRMNIYRLLHAKSMLIVLLVTIAMSGLNTYMTHLELEDIVTELQQTPESEKIGFTLTVKEAEPTDDFGIYVQMPELVDGKPAAFLEYFCMDMNSGILLLFISAAVVIFINGEEKTGFVKNIAGQTTYKSNIYFSKLPVMAVYVLICMAAYGAMQFAMLKYIWGDEIDFGSSLIKESLPRLALLYFLFIAFSGGLIMITVICKSTAAGITIGILSACGFFSILTGAIERLTDLDVSNYLLVNAISRVTIDAGRTQLLQVFAVGIVFFILYNLVGVLWFTKRDVV